MAIDTSALTDYAWSDIAKAAKMAMMSAALGGSKLKMPDGREIGRITIDEAKKLYDIATANANAEAEPDTGGGIVLGVFGDAQ